MREAYIEVLKSYPLRLFSKWTGWILLVGSFGPIVGSFGIRAHPDFGSRFGSLSSIMMGLSFLGTMLWMHFRDLIVNPNRQLSPGPVAPNLATFVTFSAVLVLLWPAMLLPTFMRSLGLIALTTVWFAYLGFWLSTMSIALALVGVIPYVWLCIGPLGKNMQAFLSGNYPGLAAGIIVLSIGAIAIEVIYLIRLTEDDPRYHRRMLLDTWSLKPRMTGDVNRVWSETSKSQPLGWPGLRTLIFIPPTSTLWNRSRRWRMLTSGTLKGSFFIIAILMAGFELSWRGNPTRFLGDISPGLAFVAVLLNLMPPLSVSQMWLNQWRFVEAESLRPMDRRGLLHELGLALAIDMAMCWIISAIGMIIGVTLILGPSIDRTGLAIAILASAFLLVPEFGLIISLMTFRSPALNIMGCIGMMIGIVPIIMLGLDSNLGPFRAVAVAVALVLSVLGIFIIRSAQQMWMSTELG